MARSSTRLVNSLRDRGHQVTALPLVSGFPPDPSRLESILTVDAARLQEPERIFWEHKRLIEESLLVGFGGNLAGYLAALWARWTGARSLVLFRGNDFDRTLHNSKAAWMTHFILQQATTVGAVSREMARRIQTLRNGPVVFTPNSVDVSQWQPLARDREQAQRWREERGINGHTLIGVFGELKAKKGLDLTCRLFTSLGLSERARLLTVGSLTESLQTLQSDPASSYWLHVPFQTRETLPVYYAASDIVFIPSLYDGMPNVLLEALAAGRIVAASRAGGMPDVLEDGNNGFLFETGDADDAARVLNRILDLDQESREALSVRAVQSVRERFSPEQEIRNIEEALQPSPERG